MLSLDWFKCCTPSHDDATVTFEIGAENRVSLAQPVINKHANSGVSAVEDGLVFANPSDGETAWTKDKTESSEEDVSDASVANRKFKECCPLCCRITGVTEVLDSISMSEDDTDEEFSTASITDTEPRENPSITCKVKSQVQLRKSNAKYIPGSSGNANRPRDYGWTTQLLDNIARNRSHTCGCINADTCEPWTPLFIIIGSCPNSFCGMQSIMFCTNGAGRIDFWWVKPSAHRDELERETLNRHSQGPHKNAPGRSGKLYQVIADVFQNKQSYDGWTFGIEDVMAVNEQRAQRAFLQGPNSDRVYIYCIWQEDWTSNPLAWTAYVKGRLIYQKDIKELCFYSRQFVAYDSGHMRLSDFEQEGFVHVLPGDQIKALEM